MIRNVTGYVAYLNSAANGVLAFDGGALFWGNRNHSHYSLYAPGAATSDVHINASRVVPTGPQNAPETIAERWFRRVV